MREQEWKSPRNIILGSLFAAMAVGFQATALVIPLIGVSLSAFSTLPVALAAYLNPFTGLMTMLVAVIILGLVSMPQAVILLFSTGILGLVLGILLRHSISCIYMACAGGIVFAGGLLVIGVILGVPVFPLLSQGSGLVFLLLALGISSLYSFVWSILLDILFKRLEKHF